MFNLPTSSTCLCRFLDAAHLCLSAHFVYYYIVVNYDNPSALLAMTWSYKVRFSAWREVMRPDFISPQLRSVVDVCSSLDGRRIRVPANPGIGICGGLRTYVSRCTFFGILVSHIVHHSLYTLRLWTCKYSSYYSTLPQSDARYGFFGVLALTAGYSTRHRRTYRAVRKGRSTVELAEGHFAAVRREMDYAANSPVFCGESAWVSFAIDF